jgi:hypothetical protein
MVTEYQSGSVQTSTDSAWYGEHPFSGVDHAKSVKIPLPDIDVPRLLLR